MADNLHEKIKPTCFIAMPISTPLQIVGNYGGNENHFRDVYDELIEPAVREAGFEACPPETNATLDIRAEIIRKLYVADLVLVDLSSLNANVIFEFGIRTSFDKPICLIGDDKTKDVPFDFSGIHRLEYDSALLAKTVRADVPRLAEHITASFAKSEGKNPLWRYFSLGFTATPKGTNDPAQMFGMVMEEIRQVRAEVRQAWPQPRQTPPKPAPRDEFVTIHNNQKVKIERDASGNMIVNTERVQSIGPGPFSSGFALVEFAQKLGQDINVSRDPNRITVKFLNDAPPEMRKKIMAQAHQNWIGRGGEILEA